MSIKTIIKHTKRIIAYFIPMNLLAWGRRQYDKLFYRACPTKMPVGNKDVRHIDVARIHAWSVVYSAGIGGNMTFEHQLANIYDCEVFAFDPSPQGKETAAKAENMHAHIHFYPRGIAGEDKELLFDAPTQDTWGCYTLPDENTNEVSGEVETESGKERFPCRSISSLMKEFWHKKIDLLKMDIEWFEYEVLEDIFSHGLDIKQICLEFHDFFDHIPYEKTAHALRMLAENGYECIHRHMKDYTFARNYDLPKISVSTISRHHLFEMARSLSSIHRLYQFFSCFPGAESFGIRAYTNKRYRKINYYFVQICALLPIIRNRKNRYAWQTKRFGEEVKKDYAPCDILISNIGSANNILADAKKQGTHIVIEQWSTYLLTQARLMQEEYARRGKSYAMPSQQTIDEHNRVFQLADLITIPSQWVKRSFEEHNLYTDKLFVNKYGVKTDVFYDRGGRREDKFILINAWAQELRKGTLYGLQAREALHLENAEYRIIGNVLPDIQGLIMPYKKNPTIRFWWGQPQPVLAKAFSQASCFLIPSIEEGLATTPLQGMACGLPVISNINSWWEDCVVEGYNGLLAKTRDVEDIAEKVLWMYTHRDDCAAMWKNASAYIQKEHSRDNYAARAYEKYLSLQNI